MAKFCTKCGRPLAEGEVCSCQAADAAQAVPQGTTPVNPTPVVPPVTPVAPQGAATPVTPAAPQGVPVQGTPFPGAAIPGAAQGIPNPGQPQGAPGAAFQGQPQGMPYQGQPQGMPYQQAAPAQPSQVGIFMQKLLNSYVALIKEPVTAGRSFVASADYTLAIAFIAIQAVLVALFGTLYLAKIGSYLNTLMGMFAGSISLPYVSAYLGTLAVSAVFSFALAGILLGANLIFKNQVNYMQMLCEVAMRSVLGAPVIIVAIVLTWINPVAGIVVFFAANLWGVIVIAEINPKADEKSANMVSLGLFLAFFVFMIVCMFVMYRCIGLYVPSDLNLGDLSSLSGLLY